MQISSTNLNQKEGIVIRYFTHIAGKTLQRIRVGISRTRILIKAIQMARDKDLKKLLTDGRKYEMLVARKMKTYHGYILDDLSLDKEYYHKGDMRVNDFDIGLSYLLEVKSDNKIAETGRMFLELKTVRKNKKYVGWFFNPYERMAYIDTRKQIVYMIDYKKLQSEIDIEKSKVVTFKNKNGNTGEGIVIDVKDAVKRGWIYDRWKYCDDDYDKAVRLFEKWEKDHPDWMGMSDTSKVA